MSKEFKKIFKIIDHSKVKISEEYIDIEQFYLDFYPRIRCRNFNNNCTMAVKVVVENNEKIEHSFSISKKEYEELKKQRVSKLMTKRRHEAIFETHIGIYDEFHGELNLNILSMEFESREEMDKFKTPLFLLETGDILTVEELKFKNTVNTK